MEINVILTNITLINQVAVLLFIIKRIKKTGSEGMV